MIKLRNVESQLTNFSKYEFFKTPNRSYATLKFVYVIDGLIL